jgi:hypothetical protein
MDLDYSFLPELNYNSYDLTPIIELPKHKNLADLNYNSYDLTSIIELTEHKNLVELTRGFVECQDYLDYIDMDIDSMIEKYDNGKYFLISKENNEYVLILYNINTCVISNYYSIYENITIYHSNNIKKIIRSIKINDTKYYCSMDLWYAINPYSNHKTIYSEILRRLHSSEYIKIFVREDIFIYFISIEGFLKIIDSRLRNLNNKLIDNFEVILCNELAHKLIWN